MFTPADRDWIEQRAHAAGFCAAGIAAVPQQEDPHLAGWLAAGRAGEMAYLHQTDAAGNLLRADLRRSTPWARSVIVCAVDYSHPTAPLSTDPALPTAGWIARYAWFAKPANQLENRPTGKLENSPTENQKAAPGNPPTAPADYHHLLLTQLRQLDAELHHRFAALRTRCYVDTGPFLERDLAARAGIGWIGKNTCVLSERHGSWLLLGVILTSLDLAPAALSVPATDRCGTCTLCIDACPTAALIPPATPTAPRQMDATRCIAYLTIEKKGSIPADLRAPMGRHVFGCDICQDVCPWNDKARRSSQISPISFPHSSSPHLLTSSTDPSPTPATTAPQTPPLPARPLTDHPLPARPLPVRQALINPDLAWLASLEGPAFTRIFRGSPIEPTRREATRRRRLRRNIAIAMGNSGDPAFLPQLQLWSANEDPALAESATWAITRLQSP